MSRKKQSRESNFEGIQLQGWPGYRTRGQRSGLDPVDTRAETGHMQGVFIRNLITLRARTRNPIYLTLMFIFGVLPFAALVWLLLFDMPVQPNLASWFYLIIVILLTGAITVNFVASILEIFGVVKPTSSLGDSSSNSHKKRSLKRRKDYK